MLYIIVAGVPGCRKLAAISSATEYLTLNFPNFIVHWIFVKPANWKVWLRKITEKNGWNHFTLPIVWKERPYRGGKQYLIGGYSSFMKYCTEYYGVKFSISKEMSKMNGFKMIYKDIHDKESLKLTNMLPRYVCIYGSGSILLPQFLPSLIKISGLASSSGLILGLYEEDKRKRELIEGYAEEFVNILPSQTCSSLYVTAHVIMNLKNALANCDLLLVIIPEYDHSTSSSQSMWAQSVAYSTKIGNALAFDAKCDIRIIIISESQDTPICLCAAALAQAAVPNVKSQNIVAVTSGIGVMIRSMLAYTLNLPLSYIESVAVWGFTGISRIVEPIQTSMSEEILTDNLSVIAKEWITNSEFRTEFLRSYLWPLFGRRMEEMKILLRRGPSLAQLDTLVEIVCHWYSENTSRKQTYLGIYSDGTFGIPPGIFFSQPVILNDGVWRPNQEHPLPADQYCKICDLFYTSVILTDIYLTKDRYSLQLLGFESDMMLDGDKNVEINAVNSLKELAQGQIPSVEKINSNIEIVSVEDMAEEKVLPGEQDAVEPQNGSRVGEIFTIVEQNLQFENESIKRKSQSENQIDVDLEKDSAGDQFVAENQPIVDIDRGSVEITFSTEGQPHRDFENEPLDDEHPVD